MRKMKNVKDKLQKIDKDHYSLLVEIGKIAQEEKQKVYLVGGMVRDLLLGFDNLDIDIIVENNAKLLAETLVKKILNCQLSAKHDKFHTAKIVFNINNKKIPIDLASTRKEIYREPAALPDVEVTTLENDLRRRDFTINALAVSLMPKDFGDVIDFFGGLEDLKTKKIRAVPNDERHENNIFVEDPTRMIRAVRFAVKLGFEIEEFTKELLEETINTGRFDNLIEKIRGDRVKIEIRYLFNLPNIEEAVNKFFDSGIYRMVSTRLRHDEKRRKIITRADTFLKKGLSVNSNLQWLVYLAILIENLEGHKLKKILGNLQLTGDEINTIISGLSAYEHLTTFKMHIPKQFINSVEVYKTLQGLAPESILIVELLLVGYAKVFANVADYYRKVISLIDEYLEKTSKIKLEITGQDLISIGIPQGKKIGAILDRVLEKKIKNPDMTKEEEITEAKNLLKSIKL